MYVFVCSSTTLNQKGRCGMCETSELCSKTQALDMIEKIIGFPRPQPRFLSWYFRECDGLYMPIVNFLSLSQEIRERNLVRKLGSVLHFDHTSCERQAVIVEIYGVIKKHEISSESETSNRGEQ